jgi:hypothetical protein
MTTKNLHTPKQKGTPDQKEKQKNYTFLCATTMQLQANKTSLYNSILHHAIFEYVYVSSSRGRNHTFAP